MAGEAMYKHLWIPKRTARDWGKTDYRIIRNWTPRVPKQDSSQSEDSRNQSSQSPGHSAAPANGHARTSEESCHDGDDTQAQEENVTEFQAEETIPVPSSLRSLQRVTRSTSNRTDTEDHVNSDEETQFSVRRKRARPSRPTGGPTGESIAKRARLSTEDRTTEEGEGERENDNKHASDEIEAIHEPQKHSYQTLEKRILRSDTRTRTHKTPDMGGRELSSHPLAGRQKVYAAPVRLGGGETDSGETGRSMGGSESEHDEPEVEHNQQKRTTRGKTKRAATKSTSFKLWQTHYQRNGRDLNELDICFSVYDTAMRDAIDEETAGPVVQKALIQHWKMTKKHVLSTIRDLSIVSALEKRYRQEVSKHRKLQQEGLTSLKTLRQVNGQYLQSASKAKSTRQAHKLSVEQSEVDELSREVSAYVARHSFQ